MRKPHFNEEVKRDGITTKLGVFYAFGHIIVDLLGGFWLSYGLFYVREVVKLDINIAKYALLGG
jgi:hypothetical protein